MDLKIKHTKFQSIWHGTYTVQFVLPNNTMLLVNNDNFDTHANIVNVAKLKHYNTDMTYVGTALSLHDIHKTLAAKAKDQHITQGEENECSNNQVLNSSYNQRKGVADLQPKEDLIVSTTMDMAAQKSKDTDIQAMEGKSPTGIPYIHINHVHVDQIMDEYHHHQFSEERIIIPMITREVYT